MDEMTKGFLLFVGPLLAALPFIEKDHPIAGRIFVRYPLWFLIAFAATSALLGRIEGY